MNTSKTPPALDVVFFYLLFIQVLGAGTLAIRGVNWDLKMCPIREVS